LILKEYERKMREDGAEIDERGCGESVSTVQIKILVSTVHCERVSQNFGERKADLP